MQKLLILFVLLLFLFVSGLAQGQVFSSKRSLTIKNIRFQNVSAHPQVLKTVLVEENELDVYTAHDVIHIKVIPNSILMSDSESGMLTLGIILITSEKKEPNECRVQLLFDLTDGDVAFPCSSWSGGAMFLHRTTNEEVILRKELNPKKIRLIAEHEIRKGAVVSVSIKAAVESVVDRSGGTQKRTLRGSGKRGQ